MEEEEPETPATKKAKPSDEEIRAIAWPEGITDEDVLAQTAVIIGGRTNLFANNVKN